VLPRRRQRRNGGGSLTTARRTLIIEDVITTGGQVVLSADQLLQQGADLVGVLCVIDRSGGANEVVTSGLELRSLFTAGELLQ